jgi:hypothetical protein
VGDFGSVFIPTEKRYSTWEFAGTPQYSSPEIAKGDLFIIFYLMIIEF